MQKKLTIALAQLEITSDPAVNLENIEGVARRAASQGADMIVFPEMVMGLPTPDRPPADIAAGDKGGFVRGLRALAANTGLIVTAGCWETVSDRRRVHNTVFTFSPEGRTLAAYRKIHLFDALSVRESDEMIPGDAHPPVITVAGIRIGYAICYDLRFPELFRYLAGEGAQLVVVPAAWYQGPMKEAHWLTLLQARAIENTFYVAGCNLIGPSFCGRSALFDPFGVQRADAGEEPGLFLRKITTGRIEHVRRKLPCLLHRRNDIFP